MQGKQAPRWLTAASIAFIVVMLLSLFLALCFPSTFYLLIDLFADNFVYDPLNGNAFAAILPCALIVAGISALVSALLSLKERCFGLELSIDQALRKIDKLQKEVDGLKADLKTFQDKD